MVAEPAGVDPFLLLLRGPVQAELRMSDDQKQQARTLIPEAARAIDVFKRTPYPPAGTPEALLAAGERLRAENYRLAAKVLLPEQYTRLEKLVLQMEGPIALAHPEITRKLSLTREQTKRVRGVAYELIMADHVRHPPGGTGISTEETVMADRVMARQARDAAAGRISRVLNARQKAAFNDMLGPPIDLSKFDPDLPNPAASERRRGAASSVK
jgi:hypothetical protein